jgi:hypothetical protein
MVAVYFGIDIGPYWFEPLGRCFAKSEAEIEREAKRIIRVEWKYSGSSRWDADERARRKIFRDRETWHSHSSYPRADDLHFYHAYHTMMIIAGKLLSSVPVHRDPSEEGDSFQDWLSRHDLSAAT